MIDLSHEDAIAIREVTLFQGTELLVWYGDCYLQFMGIPVALKEMGDGTVTEQAVESLGTYSLHTVCV